MREKVRSSHGFLIDCKSFPMNALSNGNIFNTVEAKP